MGIKTQIKVLEETIRKSRREILRLREVDREFGHLSEMEDIGGVSVYDPREDSMYGRPDSTSPLYVTFMLQYARQDSRLPHALAQFLGVKFDKKPSTWQGALDCSATIPPAPGQDRGRVIQITNYLPKSCTLITVVEDLPEEKWEIKKTKTVQKVKCSGGGIGEPDEIQDYPEAAPALVGEDIPF